MPTTYLTPSKKAQPWYTLCAMVLAAVMTAGCSLKASPLSSASSMREASSDLDKLILEQKAPEEPISLYQAMARAILYNRDRRMNLMESALAEKQADLSKFDMLPNLAANAGYLGRDSYNASRSVSVTSGRESLEPSYSSEKDQAVSDVTFTWNVLDFGLSYVRANQQSDRHLIALEKERKAIHILLRDVRKAWWEALSAQRLVSRLDQLSSKVQTVLNNSQKMEQDQVQSPMDALSFQRSLMQILRALQSLRQDLSGASYNLAALMGLPPGISYTIRDPGNNQPVIQADWNAVTLEKAALVLRSELMESRYENRIAHQEARAALLNLLPHLNLDFGWRADSNTYLVDNTWWNWGTNISFNLFNAFKAPWVLDAAKTKKNLADQQRIALSMTVLMQVHLARLNHMMALHTFQLDDQYLNIQQRIMNQTEHTAKDLQGETVLIREQLDLLLAEARRAKSYADLQDSYGKVLVSVGIDPLDTMKPSVTLEQLSEQIQNNIESWNQQKMADLVHELEIKAGTDIQSTSTSVENKNTIGVAKDELITYESVDTFVTAELVRR